MGFADNLRFYLMIRDMNQKTFADKIGRTQASVSEWVSGKTSPQLSLLPAIAEVLGVRPSDLVEEDRPPLNAYMEESDFREAVKLIAEAKMAYRLSDAWAEKMIQSWARKWGMFHLSKDIPDQEAAHTEGSGSIGGSGASD